MTTKKTETPKTVIVKKKRAVGKSTTSAKEVVEVEDVTEPTEEEIQESMLSQAEAEFIQSMKQGELPPEARGRNQYIFHRQTGRKLISFKEIYQNRKDAFEIWAKTEEYALELFMKRTQWKKYKGDTPCPIPE